MGLGLIRIPRSLLGVLLQLPDTYGIKAMHVDEHADELLIRVESDQIPAATENHLLPLVELHHKQIPREVESVEVIVRG